MVFVHHAELRLENLGVSSRVSEFPALYLLGKLGVVLFFVLSGFLITYLLLEEEKKNGTISVVKFYMRRVLRIWPLYYLIVGLSLFVFPHIEFFTLDGWSTNATGDLRTLQIFLYIFFFANLALKLTGPLLHASHSWSIGTEEQFYLVWPVLFKASRKYRVVLLWSIILGYMFLWRFFNHQASGIVPYNGYIMKYLELFNIDCMAIGGLFGLGLFSGSKWIKRLTNNSVLLVSIASVSVMIILNIRVPYYTYELYAVPFAIIILNLSTNKGIKNLLEQDSMLHLGKISYGLYMYHPLMLFIISNVAKQLTGSSIALTLVVYFVGATSTVLISSISYKYFESPFLKLKHHFS